MIKKDWRLHTEEGFARFSNCIYAHKLKILVLSLISIAGLISHFPKITFDTSTEGFLNKDAPQILPYNDFRDQLGRDEKSLLLLKPIWLSSKTTTGKHIKLPVCLKKGLQNAYFKFCYAAKYLFGMPSEVSRTFSTTFSWATLK